MPDKLITEVIASINKHKMLKAKDQVLVGFSGGPDSMALLHALHQLKSMLRIRLYAVHINHQLRQKDADRDEQFCLSVCAQLGVPVRSCTIGVREYAKRHKMSIEEAARALRYRELLKYAGRHKCNKIAIGHNANDNCETVIFNLSRGAGLAGLAGIPPVRTNIIRPLIETTRKDIMRYLKTHQLKYCLDRSNIELGYRRNFIRHKIIPPLESINPNLVKTIQRTSEILRATNENIETMANQAFKQVLCRSKAKSPSQCQIDTKKLLSYNLLIRREIIKKMVPRLDFDAINRVLALAQKPAGKCIDLDKDYVAWQDYGKLTITRKTPLSFNHGKTWVVNLNSETKIPDMQLHLTARELNKPKTLNRLPVNDRNHAWFDKSALALPLTVRTRKPADRFVPYKGRAMKLKDVLINDKIPARLRSRLPLLCDRHNILWVIGSRRSNLGLIKSDTKEIIEVKVLK